MPKQRLLDLNATELCKGSTGRRLGGVTMPHIYEVLKYVVAIAQTLQTMEISKEGRVRHPCDVLLRQEGYEFESNVGYTVRPCITKRKK